VDADAIRQSYGQIDLAENPTEGARKKRFKSDKISGSKISNLKGRNRKERPPPKIAKTSMG
jgi:hypothetical protein